MTRREARENVMKLLFEVSYRMDEMESILNGFEDENELSLNDKEYIFNTVRGTVNNLSSIDDCIEGYSQGWKISRLSKVDLTILRLAIYEIVYGDTPKQVAINEAVELAKKYSTDKSGTFINGLLANVSK